MSYKKLEISAFGGPEVLRIAEEKTLPEPSENEVLIKVKAVSASFTDIMIREGKYPDVKEKPPITLGYDMVGTVEKVGEQVTEFKKGQMVADLMVTGACSEYICVPANRLTLVPEGLDPGEAVSLVLSYVTAWQMLHRVAKVQPGQKILIHGASGAVGTAMIQLSKLMDLKVYGTASKPKHQLISDLGAIPIDYKKEDFVEFIKSDSEEGLDAVFDPIGGEHLKRSFSTLRKNGKLVCFGFYNAVMGKGGSIPIDFLRLKFWDIWPNNHSATLYSIGAMRKKHPDWFSKDLNTLFELLRGGKIKPVIDRRMSMEEAPKAYELIEKAEVQGKIIFQLN